MRARSGRAGRRPERRDPDFAHGFAWESVNAPTSRHGEHKARQLCRQVQRALNLALAERGGDPSLGELFVDEVTPAPDCGHLLVHVIVPAGCSIADALGGLRRDTPRLRSHVAMAITRKRAPELSFVPTAPAPGDVHLL